MITLDEKKETGPKTRNLQEGAVRDTKQGPPVEHDEDHVVKWTPVTVTESARSVGLTVMLTPMETVMIYDFATPNGFKKWRCNGTVEAVSFIKGFQMLQFMRNFRSA